MKSETEKKKRSPRGEDQENKIKVKTPLRRRIFYPCLMMGRNKKWEEPKNYTKQKLDEKGWDFGSKRKNPRKANGKQSVMPQQA